MIYGTKIWGPKAWKLLHSFSIDQTINISKKKQKKYLKHISQDSQWLILTPDFRFLLLRKG